MNNSFSSAIKSDLVKAGVYQVIGGLIGIIFMIRSAMSSNFLNEWVLFFYMIFLLFFGYSILCGWLCLKFNKNALWFSLINQYLQLIQIAVGGFSFSYVAGFYLSVGIDLTESFNLSFDAGLSTLRIFLNNGTNFAYVNLNLIALLLVYWINRLIKQVKLENEIEQADSIGTAGGAINE